MKTFRNWIEEALKKRIDWSPIHIGKKGGRDYYLLQFEDGSEKVYYIDFEEKTIEEY